MPRGRRGAAIAAAAAALALAASGCASSGSHSGGSSGTAASSDKTITVTIDLTPQGCTPKSATITAGAVQFNVTNKDAGSVSEAELRTGDLAKIPR